MTKKNSAWSRYSGRRKQTTIDQGLISSSAQAQLHQAPVNDLENDLIYMECFCLFIYHTISSKKLFRIWWSL